jgi:8-oxo-dGTP pyrophosphatase MutT (NUDIX family)
MANRDPPRPWPARLLTRTLHVYWRFQRGLTLGVRAAAIDAEGRVFLVRHSYTPGWHLPGGGVEPGETLREALERELREEGNIELTGEPALHGIFFNAGISRRDPVAVYAVRAFRQTAPRPPDREIVETGFFAPDALPAGVTAGTGARIAEIIEGRPAPAMWIGG